MDKNTENGYDPDYVAREIINSLCLEDEEIFIARYAFSISCVMKLTRLL